MPSLPDNWPWLAAMSAAAMYPGSAGASPSIDESAPAMSSLPDQPISLIVEKDGPLVSARVVAAGACACSGHFRIESESGTSNRTANTSSFSSLSDAGRVLSNIRFGGSDDWRVKLIVSIDGRDEYTVVRSSTDG
ncbi:hypothetical protein [Blastomonas fulva]|uniref:hypothetical protein n=1 Tax=Blastomonas fulva TaxID=1550728 RepID=UPI003F72449E